MCAAGTSWRWWTPTRRSWTWSPSRRGSSPNCWWTSAKPCRWAPRWPGSRRPRPRWGHPGGAGGHCPRRGPKTGAPPTDRRRPPAAHSPIAPPVRHLAHRLGVDTATIHGTGKGGAITRADVEHAVAARPAGARVRSSPRARRLAAELGVELAAVSGTGPEGAVTVADVQHAAAGHPAAAPPEAGPGRRRGSAGRTAAGRGGTRRRSSAGCRPQRVSGKTRRPANAWPACAAPSGP